MSLRNYITSYENKLNTLGDIEQEALNFGWTYKKATLSPNLLATSDSLNQVIYISDNLNENLEFYVYAHEFYHLLENEMANLSKDTDLEIADFFASILIVKKFPDLDFKGVVPESKYAQLLAYFSR